MRVSLVRDLGGFISSSHMLWGGAVIVAAAAAAAAAVVVSLGNVVFTVLLVRVAVAIPLAFGVHSSVANEVRFGCRSKVISPC